MAKQMVAVIGGGIAGLTASLRLLEQGYQVDLYESAPALGGRTKSFFDESSQAWVDNGPHMMVGAYHATKQLLNDVGASHHVSWQDSLTLPLWDQRRGHFALQATAKLPIALALLLAVGKLPNHDFSSVKAMLYIALSMKNIKNEQLTVAEWLKQCHAPAILIQDMLEVLCLGVMNEPLETANAKTFARVLNTSFSSHNNAKMGWFNKPLSQALVAPIVARINTLGGKLHLGKTIRDINTLNHDATIIALPAFARNRLLGIQNPVATQAITNIHLWFDKKISMPSMMLGMLGTYSQWLFDINTMFDKKSPWHHFCVTVSADTSNMSKEACLKSVLQELQAMISSTLPALVHSRIIREKRATVLVRNCQKINLAKHVFDACESPYPGQLPATIELAVLQGEKSAIDAQNYLNKRLTQ